MQVSFLKAKKDNICIPVMAESLKQLMADGVGGEEYAVCDIIELRIDYIKEDIIEETKKILGYLKEIFPKKLFIVTYRTAVEGGMGDLGGISEELFCDEYKKLILQLVKEVRCDFIDVEINRGAHIVGEVAVEAHNRNIAVIGSYHNFKSTPDDEEMIRVLKCIDSSEADVLKMAVMPEGENDVARLMKVTSIATHMFDKPLITMSMGELGTISRVYGFLYGSSVTFGTASAASAPGQINALQLYKDMQIAGNIKIALIGFMGSGKSAVSDALTSVLGIACKDTDKEIVSKEGRSIPDIFETDGEEYFRTVETSVTKEILKSSEPMIVSCGGGVIKKEENRELLKEYAVTCLLEAKPETILERVKGDTNRPLLKGKMNVEDIDALMQERKSYYDMTAEVDVKTDNKSTTEIAVQILNEILMFIHKY